MADIEALAKIEERQPEVISALSMAEVDMQVATAKRYPRSLDRFIKEADTMATLDQETAESCSYALKRGGSLIEGPSVRLAEICASAWGNLRCEASVVDDDGKYLTARGVAWDMERNVLVSMSVKRRVTNKDGKRYSDDMVVVTGNAAAAIAFRNAVFKVIPAALKNRIYSRVQQVAVGTEKTLEDRRSRAFAWFKERGVSESRLLEYLEKPSLADVGLQDLAQMQGLKTALSEGDTSIEDVFPAVVDPLKPGREKTKKQEQQPEQKTAAEDKQDASSFEATRRKRISDAYRKAIAAGMRQDDWYGQMQSATGADRPQTEDQLQAMEKHVDEFCAFVAEQKRKVEGTMREPGEEG